MHLSKRKFSYLSGKRPQSQNWVFEIKQESDKPFTKPKLSTKQAYKLHELWNQQRQKDWVVEDSTGSFLPAYQTSLQAHEHLQRQRQIE